MILTYFPVIGSPSETRCGQNLVQNCSLSPIWDILFVHAKDPRALCRSPGSLWILEELDFKNVLKKRTLQSVDYNLLSSGQMSLSNLLGCRVGDPFRTRFGPKQV